MFTAIVKNEILEALSSARFLITLVLCLVLIPLGVFVNLKDYQKRETEYRQAEDLRKERLALMSLEYDSRAVGYRPPSVLGIFSTGLESALPNHIRTSWEGEYKLGHEQTFSGNLDTLLFGRIDLLFNVGFVLSCWLWLSPTASFQPKKRGACSVSSFRIPSAGRGSSWQSFWEVISCSSSRS